MLDIFTTSCHLVLAQNSGIFETKNEKHILRPMGPTGHSTALSMTPILTGKAYDMDLLDRERVRTRIYKLTGIVDSELLTIMHIIMAILHLMVLIKIMQLSGCYWWNGHGLIM